MRVVVRPASGFGHSNRLEQFDGAAPGLGPRRAAVDDDRLGDLVADGEHRVERGHRLLEDQRDAGAAHLPHLAFRERQQIASVEEHAARRRFGRAAAPAAGSRTRSSTCRCRTRRPSPAFRPARTSKLTSSTARRGRPSTSKTVVRRCTSRSGSEVRQESACACAQRLYGGQRPSVPCRSLTPLDPARRMPRRRGTPAPTETQPWTTSSGTGTRRHSSTPSTRPVAQDPDVQACRERARADGFDLKVSLEAVVDVVGRIEPPAGATGPAVAPRRPADPMRSPRRTGDSSGPSASPRIRPESRVRRIVDSA